MTDRNEYLLATARANFVTDKLREPTASMLRAAERAAQGVPRETLARQMGVTPFVIDEWLVIVERWRTHCGEAA